MPQKPVPAWFEWVAAGIGFVSIVVASSILTSPRGQRAIARTRMRL